MTKRANEIGAAGEHLVCADLLLAGYRAMLAAATLPYDVIAEVGGRLLRVTVKSTLQPKTRPARPGSKPRYHFNIGRCLRTSTGKTFNRAYDVADVDLVALVALDIRRVAYIPLKQCPRALWLEASTPQVRRTFGPRPKLIAGFDDYPLTGAISG